MLRPLLVAALRRARRVFAVSESLRQVAIELGTEPARARVVGNGVDIARFTPLPQADCRARLGLSKDAKVLVTVGGLVERKGFHRVLKCLPALRQEFPQLHYLAIGGPSLEGDWTERLQRLAIELGVADAVRFTGPISSDELSRYLSAADVFVLATRNEGWANVFLEAMACGLPVVTTDVGGNAEVVCRSDLGTVVPFDDEAQLTQAMRQALLRDWDRGDIRRHAEANTWDRRIDDLEQEFRALAAPAQAPVHASASG